MMSGSVAPFLRFSMARTLAVLVPPFTTAAQPPTVSIPSNLSFLSGTSGGTIVLGGSPIAVVVLPFTAAQGQGYSQQARNNYSLADKPFAGESTMAGVATRL